jgi:hypothetical protein
VYDPPQCVGVGHIPASSLFPDRSLAGRGFYPSSPGNSLPALSLDARSPSITFAPIVSVCKGSPSAARQLTVDPASWSVPSFPLTLLPPAELPPVILTPVLPPAEPPPPVLLPPVDLSLSGYSHHPEGSLFHRLMNDTPISPQLPFDHLPDRWDTMAPVFLSDSPRGPRSFGSVSRIVTCPRVLWFQGGGRSYARINLTALAPPATPGRLIDGGANICITGDLDSLFDVVTIPPLAISVAVEGTSSIDDCCTARGLTPIQLDGGSIYWQVCYFCANVVKTIISPQAIVDSSDVFQSWQQKGYQCGVSTPVCIRFDSHDGLLTMKMSFVLHDGLHYCPTDVYAVDDLPASRFSPAVWRVVGPAPLPVPGKSRSHKRFIPTSKAKQIESEVWLIWLGSPGVHQLDLLPGQVNGIPLDFQSHPFHYIDHKEQALIKKRPAQKSAVRTSECKRRFYMDFGFMRSSTSDYAHPNKSMDRVVSSYDGYTSYLLIIDEASRMAWVFLTKSKDPPLDIVRAFLTLHGHSDGGCVRTDQGGELASSGTFRDLLLREFRYTLEPTGADSPSQNGAVEIYNDKFGIRTRALLYDASLPEEYWSAALVHSVYLHNRLVHSSTLSTPFGLYYGVKPDLEFLKTFGS